MATTKHHLQANFFFITIISLSLFLSVHFSYAQTIVPSSSAGVDVGLVVSGCNNNGICEPILGENEISCTLDCTMPPTPTSTPTTTPPVSRTESGHSTSYGSKLVITSMSISSDQQSAIINWSGNNTALSVFSWGLTPDYEIGSISDVFFITNHRVGIKNLTPGTHYYFKINARDLYGHIMNYFGDFTTLSFAQLSMLPNVQDLVVTYPSGEITLTWINPQVTGFAGVIVVRSPYTYPRDPSDGKIIYEGEGNYVTDLSAQKNTIYYYTVFVYDSKTNYSSGSIVKSVVNPVKPTSSVSPITLPFSFSLKLSDFDFIQNGRSSIFQNSPVEVVADKNLTVSISAAKLPAPLRLGTLQVDDPTSSHSSTYLFSFNKSRNSYESQMNLFGVSEGMYPFTLNLQFATSGEVLLSGVFDVTKSQVVVNKSFISEWQNISGIFWIIIIFVIVLILVILVGLIIYLIIRRFSSHKN